MQEFEFHPDLFALRGEVMEALSDAEFVWLTDYGAIDLAHDIYGLEVCGIREEHDARTIEQILIRMFPDWVYRRVYYQDRSHIEEGWKVVMSQKPEDFSDRVLERS